MLYHMDRGNWYVSVYYINWLSGLHIHLSNQVKVYQSSRSNRGSLSHMFGCKILSGHETLGGFVTACWITGGGPTCSALNCSMSKPHGLSPEGEQISTAWPIADMLMLKMVTSAQLHATCCAVYGLKVVEIITATLSWRSSAGQTDFSELGSCNKHIHQPAFKHLLHMLWSYNEFNTLFVSRINDSRKGFPPHCYINFSCFE